MKNSIDNDELQIVLDSMVQTLSDIKEELSTIKENLSNDRTESALNTDLLTKISGAIEHAKKAIDEEDLKEFIEVTLSVVAKLQEKANEKSAEFLNQKIVELNEIVKHPGVVINKYSIDFKSSKTFIVIILLCLGIGSSLYFNYNQFRENKRLKYNDMKYRYVRMKGTITADDIYRLEVDFSKQEALRDSISLKVIEYEDLIQKQTKIRLQDNLNKKQFEQINDRIREITTD